MGKEVFFLSQNFAVNANLSCRREARYSIYTYPHLLPHTRATDDTRKPPSGTVR